MWRTLLGGLVVAHGFLTAAVWLPKYKEVEGASIQPPNTSHSWLLGDVRVFSLIFGVAVGLALAVAGVGFLAHQQWWPAVAVGAGVASLLLFAVFFTPWWTAGIAISAGLIIAAIRAGVPA